ACAQLGPPTSCEMDSVFNRFYRNGDGGGLDTLVHAGAENASLLLCSHYFCLLGSYVLRIALIPSQSSQELYPPRGHIDGCGCRRDFPAHCPQRCSVSLCDTQIFLLWDYLDPSI